MRRVIGRLFVALLVVFAIAAIAPSLVGSCDPSSWMDPCRQ